MGEYADQCGRDSQPDQHEPGDSGPKPIDCPAGKKHSRQSTNANEDERYTQLGVIERRLFAKRRKDGTPRPPE